MAPRGALPAAASLALLAAALAALLCLGGGQRAGPPQPAIALAQVPSGISVPPSALVAWTSLGRHVSTEEAVQAITSANGTVTSKADEVVEGVLELHPFRAFSGCGPIAGEYVAVHVRVYSDGTLVAYTGYLPNESLPKLAFVESVSGTTPEVKPVVLEALERVAEKLNAQLGEVHYGSTQFPDAKTLAIYWSSVRNLEGVLGHYTVLDPSGVLAAGVAWLVEDQCRDRYDDYADSISWSIDGAEYGSMDKMPWREVTKYRYVKYGGGSYVGVTRCEADMHAVRPEHLTRGTHTVALSGRVDDSPDALKGMVILVAFLR